MGKPKSRSWVWHVDRPVSQMWTLLADTARVNEASRLPRQEIEETPQSDGSVRDIARAKVGPFPLEWREKPVNWVSEQWFEHCRYFSRGPLSLLCAVLTLAPEGAGCRVEYKVEAAAANWVGRLLLATGFFPSVERTYTKMVKEAAAFAAGQRETVYDYEAPKPTPETLTVDPGGP